jgi:hypothetical protein
VGEITSLTNGDQPLAQKVVVEMTSNPVTTFVTLLTKALDPTSPASSTNTDTSGSTGAADSDTKTSNARKSQDVPIDPNVCR